MLKHNVMASIKFKANIYLYSKGLYYHLFCLAISIAVSVSVIEEDHIGSLCPLGLSSNGKTNKQTK